MSLALILIGAACGGDGSDTGAPDAMPPSMNDGGIEDASQPDATDNDASSPPLTTEIGTAERPARVVPPNDYDPSTPTPVLFLLHGYSASSSVQDLYFGLSRVTARRGIILVLPDGTTDFRGNQFWNADQRCCDFARTGVDDVGYLTGLLDEVEAAYNVDTDRVYFYGHSNGGYMSYRMACDLGSRVTAIASLAGATRTNDSDCARTRPVSILQVHGTEDTSVLYESGDNGHVGAVDGVERWATHAGCDLGAATMGEDRDFDTRVPGSESTVRTYETGCTPGFIGEVWKIEGGGHVPGINADSTNQILDWLLARRPPAE